jgi:hypothetical protein
MMAVRLGNQPPVTRQELLEPDFRVISRLANVGLIDYPECPCLDVLA